MTTPVYSKVLAWGRLVNPTGPTVGTVTVPAGRVWIIRDIDLVAQGNVDLYYQLSLDRLASPPFGTAAVTYLLAGTSLCDSIGVPTAWRGRQVLNAGDKLHVIMGSFSSPSQSLFVNVSGYELVAV